MSFVFNGKTYDIPGSYGILQVIQNSGANIPDFQIGLIIARSVKGIPYNAAGKTGSQLMRAYDNGNDILHDYGDDNVYQAYKYMAKHGGGMVFVLNAMSNTQLTNAAITPSITLNPKNAWDGVFVNDILVEVDNMDVLLVPPSNVGPVQGIVTSATSTTLTDSTAAWGTSALSQKYVKIISGAGIGQIRQISSHTATTLTVTAWDTGSTPNSTSRYQIVDPNKFDLTLTPPKDIKRLVQDYSSGGNVVYVNSPSGLAPGMNVYLNSNAVSTCSPITINSVDYVRDPSNKGYKVTFTYTTAPSAVKMMDSARIFWADNNNTETYYWDGTTSQVSDIINNINQNSNLVTATGTTNTTLPVVSAEVPMQSYTTTFATNKSNDPEGAYASDYSNICTMFSNWMKDFINVNKVKIRLVYVDSNDPSVHASFRDLAATMRTNRSPICVIAGSVWGQSVSQLASAASVLNSDDFVYCGGGADNYPASLSLAPSLFGIKMNNGVNHNLTRDQLNFSSVEADWTDSNLVSLLKGGVLTYDKFPTGFRVVRGINSYQDQTHVWNASDNKTYLQMPRDLADAFFRGLLEGLDSDLVGADQVTRKKVETYCVKTGNNFMASGLILDFKVLAIKRGEAGWLPEVQIEVDDPTDFFGTRIFVISPTLG